MRFGVRGPVQVEREGSVIPLGGPQQRRLLGALLAACGEAISAGRLVDVLWPDGDASGGAERTAMSYVSRLRAVLGDGVLLTAPTGYRLQGPTDAAEFETGLDAAEQALPDEAIVHYERALALWRGPAFGDLAGEWWAVREAARLDERRSAARERLAAALMAIGHMDRAVPDLRALAVEQPLREGPVMLLMQALNALGRQAEALRVSHRFRTYLIEETGLSPSDEMVELERAVALGGER